MRRLLLGCLLVLLPGAGACIEPFDGTYVHMDLVGVRSPCEMLRILGLTAPESWPACPSGSDPTRARTVHHYELWATIARTSVVQLTSFTVQPAALFDEQLALEQQGARLASGAPFRMAGPDTFDAQPADAQAIVRQRMLQAEQVNVITSYSPERFEADGLTLRPELYVGNYRELSQPHSGTFFGQVQGPPIGGGATVLGGAVIRFPVALYDLDSLMLTIEDADPGRAEKRPSGLVVVVGPARSVARGVVNVAAVNPTSPNTSAAFAVYEDLDQESYF